jgi:hypothetical protein
MNFESDFNTHFAPVLVIAFNRPESTRKVIDALIASGVREIYYAVDGPRLGVNEDIFRVSQVRELETDYKASLKFIPLFREENLGCRLAVTGALNWFFSQVEFGIVLEDDCVPTTDFLVFASRMLQKYQNDKTVMHVGGSSYLGERINYPYNHYFSSLHEVWGWATWARAWKYFELDPGEGSSEEEKLLIEHFKSKHVSKWFKSYLRQARVGTPSVWSTQWSLSLIRNKGVAVNPINNLVKNIGFTKDSTHGSNESFSLYDNFHTSVLSILPDPPNVEINYQLDKKRFEIIRRTDPSLFTLNRLSAELRSFFLNTLPQKAILRTRTLKNLFKGPF